MASELSTPGWEHVGDVDVDARAAKTRAWHRKSLGVWRRQQDGAVSLDVPGDDVFMHPRALDELRELLDRAAMPGQEELPRAAKCPRCGLPDGTKPAAAKACQHVWHQYRPQAEAEGRRAGGEPPAGEAREHG